MVITNSMDMCMSKFLAMVKDREVWHVAVHGVTKSQTQLSDWKTTANIDLSFSKLPSQRKVLLRLCVQMKKGFFKWRMSKSLLDLVYSKLLMHLVIYLMCFLNTFIQPILCRLKILENVRALWIFTYDKFSCSHLVLLLYVPVPSWPVFCPARPE